MRVRAELERVAFLPGVEEAPTLKIEGTWEGARFVRTVGTFSRVGHALEVTLPAGGRVESSLWLSLLARTPYSGIEDLDKKPQNKGALRHARLSHDHTGQVLDLENGAAPVSLGELAGGVTVQLDMYDTLIGHNARTLLAKDDVARQLATKATLRVRLMAPILASPPGPKRLQFGTQAYVDAMSRGLELLETQYIRFATSINVPGLSMPPRRFGVPADEDMVEHLHMARYETRAGPLPACTYVQQDMAQRGEWMRAEVKKLRAAHGATLLSVVQTHLLSSLLARGMTPSHFASVVKAQHARRDTHVASSYLTALAAVVHMATLAVTQIQYKACGRPGDVLVCSSFLVH